MKKSTLLMYSFLFFLFIACQREKKCPAFNPGDLQQIAYNESDTLAYVNQQSDTFRIYIQDIVLSGSFEQKCDFLELVCPCLNFVDILATNSLVNNPYVFLKMEQSDASDMRYFKYLVLDFNFEIDFDNELNYADDLPYLEVYGELNLNNTIYQEVVIYHNLENLSSNVSKVYLNKSKGILRIETKEQVIWDRLNTSVSD